MARKVRGMTIELSADVSKYQRAMKEAYDAAFRLENRMKDINSLLKYRPDDQGLYHQAFSTLSEQIENAKKQLEALNKVYNVAKDDFARGKIGQDELNHLQRDIKATENDIRKFETSIRNLRKSASSFDEITGKIKVLDKNLQKTKDALKEVDKALKLDPNNVELAKQKQILLKDAISDTKQKLDLVKQAQNEALDAMKKGYLGKDEYAKIASQVAFTTDELKQLTKEADKGYEKLKKMSESMESVSKNMIDTGKSMTRKVTVPIISGLTFATKETMDLEDAMAGVHKTTDMSKEELAQMQKTFVEMSKTTPVAAEDLAGIAELAGQLGIAKEYIPEFAKTISDLGIATNLTHEKGAMDLARFMNIAQMSQDEVSNLGSTIVDLGNKFATNEDEIVDMSLRLIAQAKIANLTEAETLGLAAALSSIGLKSEQGGSAFSRVMLKMNTAVLGTEERTKMLNKMLEGTGFTINDISLALKQGGKEGNEILRDIGDAIGMTGDDLKEMAKDVESGQDKLEVLGRVSGLGAEGFAKAWREEPMYAIEKFIGGLQSMKENNQDLGLVFKELGMNNIREIDTLQRLTGAHEVLGDAVGIATDAYKDNTALQEEVSIFNETTSNQLRMLKNNVVALARKLGEVLIPPMMSVVDTLKEWANKAENLDPKTIELFVKALLAIAAIGPVLQSVGWLILGLSKVASFAGEVSGELALLKKGLEVSAGGAGLFAKGLEGLAGLLSYPGGLIALGIAGLLLGLFKLNEHMQQSSVESDIFGDKVSEGTKKAVDGFLQLDEEAGIALSELKATGDIVSQETVDSISGNFGSMAGQISEKIDENKTVALESLTQMYTDMGTIDDESTKETLAKVSEKYENMQINTREGEARVKEILNTAKDEKRTLTEEEQEEINTIREQMKDDGIRVLSASEEEYLIIRQRMKDQAGEISTEQASKLVKDSLQTKEDTIANAEEEYEKRILAAETLRADGTKESNDLADKIIEDARKTRDKTIKDAEERHEKIVQEAKGQAKEHVDEVDWETGEILTKWEVLGKGIKGFFENVGLNIKIAWATFKGWIRQSANSINRKISEFERDVNTNVQRIVDGIVGWFRNLPQRISNAIGDIWSFIKAPFETAAENIKGIFDFDIQLPKINMPQPHTVGYHNIFGMQIPDIQWYKKGAIFTKPTMFNTPYGMKGVGEAGAEAVLPIEKLSEIIAEALRQNQEANLAGVTVTGNTFYVREESDIDKIARELYRLIESKKRGVGLG